MSDETPDYIEVKEIESALDALWEKHQGSNTIRASLFNLVIYVKKDLREEYLQRIAKNIIGKCPCRMFVITEFEGLDEEFLRCHVTDMLPNAKSDIFCDVINFEVSGSYRERIPFAVLPHLLSERPVYLLWGDDPLKKDPVSLKLEDRATRTIFDSESAENMVDFAKMILGHQSKILCDIADLNWARVSPWRNLFSNAFNNQKDLDCIKDAENIQIKYNTRESKHFSHTKIQATYFQGWIATRLDWKLDTVLAANDEITFKYHSDHGDVSINLAPGENPDVKAGRVLSTEIIARNKEKISFEREKSDINKIAMNHCSTSSCEMPVFYRFSQEMTGRSMMREIYNQGTDASFLKVLELITTCKKGMIS